MNYQTIELSWGELRQAPRNEVLMYLACGRVANELNFLQKILLRSSTYQSEVRAVQCAQGVATFQFLTLLAGRLHEALKLLKAHLNTLERDSQYVSEMPDEAQNAWAELKRGFSKATIVGQIRDKLAFHNDTGILADGLAHLTEDDIFEDFHTEEIGNTLFYSADRATIAALKHLTGEESMVDALHLALGEIDSCANNVVKVCWGFICVFYQKRFPEKLAGLEHSGVADFVQSLDSPIAYFHERTERSRLDGNYLFKSDKA